MLESSRNLRDSGTSSAGHRLSAALVSHVGQADGPPLASPSLEGSLTWGEEDSRISVLRILLCSEGYTCYCLLWSQPDGRPTFSSPILPLSTLATLSCMPLETVLSESATLLSFWSTCLHGTLPLTTPGPGKPLLSSETSRMPRFSSQFDSHPPSLGLQNGSKCTPQI